MRPALVASLVLAWVTALAAEPPAPNAPPPNAPATAPPRTAALVERGRASFALNCAACHGKSGEGNGPVAFAVRPRPRNLRRDPFVGGDTVAEIFATITRGLPSGTMASYAQLPEEERWALAWYVLGFRPPRR